MKTPDTDKDETPKPQQPAHKVEIEQKNGLFFVSVDGKQLTRTRKARSHRAEVTRPETFLDANTAFKAAEKEIARQRKLVAKASQPPQLIEE